MKGILILKNTQRGLVFQGVIHLEKSNRILRHFTLKGKTGQLEVGVRSDRPENLNGFCLSQDIAFRLPPIVSERKKYSATCQDGFTRKFVHWSCFFYKTGD